MEPMFPVVEDVVFSPFRLVDIRNANRKEQIDSINLGSESLRGLVKQVRPEAVLCDGRDPVSNPDLQVLRFVVLTRGGVIGAWSLYDIEWINTSPRKIDITAKPGPGIDQGEGRWNAIMKGLLDTTMTTEKGVSVDLIGWSFPENKVHRWGGRDPQVLRGDTRALKFLKDDGYGVDEIDDGTERYAKEVRRKQVVLDGRR